MTDIAPMHEQCWSEATLSQSFLMYSVSSVLSPLGLLLEYFYILFLNFTCESFCFDIDKMPKKFHQWQYSDINKTELV